MTVIVKAIAYFTSEAVYPSLRTIRVSVRSLLRLTCLRVQTVPSDRLVAPTREIYKERNLLFGANIIFSMLNPASYCMYQRKPSRSRITTACLSQIYAQRPIFISTSQYS